MTDVTSIASGFLGSLLITGSEFIENLPGWVSVICSCAIAAVTCGIQIYRLIKNRDKEKNTEEKTEETKEEEKDDDNVQ